MVAPRSIVLSVVLSFPALTTHAAEKNSVPSYERRQLTDAFMAEGANFGDFNRDGVQDIVAGPHWFAGPDFIERFEFYAGKPFDINGYSDNFLAFAEDIDQDGWSDILVIGFPGKEARWYRNPAGEPGHWVEYVAFPVVDNESPTFVDITGDGRPELVFHTEGRLGFAQINQDDPTKPWQFQAISKQRGYQKFTHGLGVGDVNNDGRADLLMKEGWWEHPAEPDAKQTWPFHPVKFSAAGGAQTLVSDVDGDGDPDVITSKHAHGYGLAWFEQVQQEGVIAFREHSIMGEKPTDSPHGVAFSQLHSLALADFNGDGIDDILTGKRFWAHQGHDPGGHDPAVLYCFLTVREGTQVRFEPHRIDTNSGVGTQVVARDVNGDQAPDIVVANKKGIFVHMSDKGGETHGNAARPLDEYPFAGISAADAAHAMDLPDGFSATVYAAEPDVKQPIAMALDDRGRVWIAEAYEYPRRAPEGKGRDRILVFDDVDGDGQFDERKVFAEGLNLVSGLEVGFGGVWVGAAPYLLFIPDRDGDDIADGEPEILLDGWGYHDTHETLNAFIWGPDGWLYGCHGVFTHSRVGKPGTPDDQRTPINAGIWRYHPTRHTFEVFAHGTSNPWGVDFDDHGQAICTACVIPHLFHVIQGGRYHRQAGTHFNPYTYDDIKTIADHAHYSGNIGDHAWWGRDTPAEDRSTDAAGGGHAHAGAMIYLGGSWPDEYRSQIFMNNIHGARINRDQLTRRGSGFVGSHRPDFLLTGDRASQIINLRYGPDGQVYLIDWYDMQQCHRQEPSAHDRANGRVFRVAYGAGRSVHVDLIQLTDRQLVQLQLHKNDWYVRHARRRLQERAATGELDTAAVERLAEIAMTHPDDTRRLRAVWALHVTGKLDQALGLQLLSDASEYVRAWTVQVTLDSEQLATEFWLPHFVAMAGNDESPVVRLYLAAAAQRLPPERRWDVLSNLARRAEDASDHNLPLMIWYAAEPLAAADPARALDFALSESTAIPKVRDFMIRRVASLATPTALNLLVQRLQATTATETRIEILSGILQGLSGRSTVELPESWGEAYQNLVAVTDDQVPMFARAVGVKFGDPQAMDEYRDIVRSEEAPLSARREAMRVLLDAHDGKLVPTLVQLLGHPALRELALAGLARYDDQQIPAVILDVYADLPHGQKRLALSTLSSRQSYAVALLQAVAAERIPVADISADLIRQLHNLKNEQVDHWIGKAWGQVRATAEDKLQLMDHYRQLLQQPMAAQADLSLGRAVFAKTCQQCHVLYGVGAKIGPDLTGSNRANLDYLLSNIVDPSGLITKEYQSTVLYLETGRVVTGVVSAEDENSITLLNATETVVIPKVEIEERVLSDVSLMPESQLKQYSPLEFVSLVAYLRGKVQVPMLATQENAAQLFNGKDLVGWHGDPALWSVQQGEIVGKSGTLEKNSFLISDMTADNFRLTLEVKLVDDIGNSGIQFRSRPFSDDGSVAGYQADIGPDWWGKLYDEHGRAVLWDASSEQNVKKSAWNKYEIVASGSTIKTWINDQPAVDLDDPEGERRGIFALQIHSGGPTEVRFRNIELEILPSEETDPQQQP